MAVDEKGKLEVAVRILGNEIVALKMEVDDFKMKWLNYEPSKHYFRGKSDGS